LVRLSDVLNFAIFICLELKEKYGILGSFDNFMEKESIDVFELGFWFLTFEKWFVVF
jgi:hypothetical protein